MRVLWITAILAFLIDQATKEAVVHGMGVIDGRVVDVWAPFLRFTMAWNEGINFGLFSSGDDAVRWGLVVVSIAISAGLVWWARGRSGLWFMLGAGLVVGGAIGNVIDRIRYGAVADFLNMSCCGIDNPYVFNVADISIFAGAALLILTTGEPRQNAAPG